MSKKLLIFILIMFIFNLQTISAAHYMVGVVNDALDGTSANGYEVVLWNPANGIDDNLTDIIGPSGNSGANNTYMIDCELLNTPCTIGDEIRVKVLNNGSDYITDYVNATVTGAGFDIMPNLTLNSPPVPLNITLDDSFSIPSGEIDLTPATTTDVFCSGVIYEYDGDSSLINVSARFFDNSTSFYEDIDDKNYHYANDTCELNISYGNSNESFFNCTFSVEYYANSGNWTCEVKAYDNLSISGRGGNATKINPLLAISVPSTLDYGTVNATEVSLEQIANVTNMGNVMMNLSLSGYAVSEGDGLAMNCTLGSIKNISIDYEKYNLTASNPGELTLSEFEVNYTNLTSNSVTEKFNLDYRRNDTSAYIDDTNATYWRIYVPVGVAGTCTGNIVFGAVQS